MLAAPIASLLILQAATIPPLMEPIRLPTTQQPVPLEQDRLAACQTQALRDPSAAILTASEWEGQATGPERSFPRQCLGHAYVSLLRWDAAERAFLAARTDRLDAEPLSRARLAAMAGNAALADGRFAAALDDFNLASSDAQAGGNVMLGGEIAADRARAMVGLSRLQDAATALELARRDAPQLAAAWLLSATLARRMNDLPAAQGYIETAAALAPNDPAVGLEGGVIAALAGRDDAARKSWQSVLATAPDSAEAATAKDYLAQLDEAPPQP